MKIALRAPNGNYACAEHGGDNVGVIHVNRPSRGMWETFDVIPVESDWSQVALLSSGDPSFPNDPRYVCAEGGGGGDVVANRRGIGPWERFFPNVDLRTAGAVAFQTWDRRHYLNVEAILGDPVPRLQARSKLPVAFQIEVVESDPLTSPVEISPLYVDGKRLRTAQSGKLWRGQGFSLFLAYRRYLAGGRRDLSRDYIYLRQHGINYIRVFGPLPWKETPDYRLEGFDLTRLKYFFLHAGDHGLRVEWVPNCYAFVKEDAVTGQSVHRPDVSLFRSLTAASYEIASECWNVMIEDANEPDVNGINTREVTKGINRHSVLCASGNYGHFYKDPRAKITDQNLYCTMHTERDSAWFRKARHGQEFMEIYKKPTLLDEPAKAVEEGFTYPGARRNPDEHVWYHTISCLWLAGSLYHNEEGKWGRVATEGMLQDTILKAINREVWSQIDPEWQLGGYTGAHLRNSPVDGKGLKINGQDIWTYSSLHGLKALSVRCALSEPQPIRGWRKVRAWGPGNSIVELTR